MVFNGDDDDGGDDALSSAYGSTSIASLMADPMIPPSHTSLSVSLFVCLSVWLPCVCWSFSFW